MDRKDLTFSQEQGLAPLPQQLKPGEISQEFRAILWAFFYNIFENNREYSGGSYYVIDSWNRIFKNAHVFLYLRPIDEYSNEFDSLSASIKTLVYSNETNRIFDFVQYVMREGPKFGVNTADVMKVIFERARLAYDVLTIDNTPTICPSATPEEGQAIKRAFDELSPSTLGGARTHLRNSAELITSGKYPDSVRESIHAVESVARVLSPRDHSTLKPALDELSKHIAIHPALKEAFIKLYGYTSDEKGVRHSLLGISESDVDQADALFMFGACASFSSYLVAKARKGGMQIE